jgi:predicted RND superfamily exporter protein
MKILERLSNIPEKFFQLIISRYKLTLIILVFITIPFGYYFFQAESYDTINSQFETDDPTIKTYERLQKQYGNEEFIVISFKSDNIFTKKNIGYIRRITNVLNQFKNEGVENVMSLTNFEDVQSDKDSIAVKKFVPDKDEDLTDEVLAKIKSVVMRKPYFTNIILSKDGKTTGIIVQVMPAKEDIKKTSKFYAKLIKAVRDDIGNEIELHFAGGPVLQVMISEISQKDFTIFFPITFFLIFALIGFSLKNTTLTLLGQINVILVIFWSVGFYIICEKYLTSITSVMGSILLAVNVSDMLHITNLFRRYRVHMGDNYEKAVLTTMLHQMAPCFWIAVTTGVGFLGLINVTVKPVKKFGLYTTIGIGLAYILTMVFIPAALMLMKKRLSSEKLLPQYKKDEEKEKKGQEKVIKTSLRFATFSINHYKSIMIGNVIIFLLACYGFTLLTYQSNLMNYIPDDNVVKKDLRFNEENLGGTIPFVMLIRSKSADKDFTHPESIRFLEEIQNYIVTEVNRRSYEFLDDIEKKNTSKGKILLTSSFSVSDYVKELNRVFKNGKDEEYVIPKDKRDLLDYYELADQKLLKKYLSNDRMEIKLSAQSVYGSNETARKVRKFVDDYMTKKIKESGDVYAYEITGMSAIFLDIAENLYNSQVSSFMTGFIVIFIAMMLWCRNLKITLISLIPNITPVVITLGLMGLFGVAINMSTVCIASISLGMSMNDTIQVLSWYMRGNASGKSYKDSILYSINITARGIFGSDSAFMIGFLVLTLSSLNSTRMFGLFIAISMLLSMIFDAFVTPALIMLFKPKLKGDYLPSAALADDLPMF